MRIVFFGSGKIAVPTLEFLVNSNYHIACVVTVPDRKKGRHLSTAFSPVKEFALSKKLNIFQPDKLLSLNTIEYLKETKPDIFIVFSFGKIIPRDLLLIPRLYPLNIHASLLPEYRGAAPINWALINGENKTGITIIKMNEKLDEGDIIQKTEIEIDYFDDAITLEDKLAKLSAQAIEETLLRIKNNKISFLKQDDKMASFAQKLKKEDGKIDWNRRAEQIRNQIRGCLPWPGTFTFHKNNLIKIFNVELTDRLKQDKHSPGEVIALDRNGILVTTADKELLIKELQVASGRKLSAWQFIQGHKIEIGNKFT